MPDPLRGYDRLAMPYRAIEWAVFGNRLDDARQALLDSLTSLTDSSPPQRVLVLGDGNGRLLAQLIRRLPEARFISVDQSPSMLKQQMARTGDQAHRVRFVASRIDRDFDWSRAHLKLDEVELVVAAFFFDCFCREELRTIAQALVASLRPHARIYWVDFLEPARPSLTTRMIRRSMLRFFRLAAQHPNMHLVDVGRVLTEAGCPVEQQWSDREGFLHAAIHRVGISSPS
ncbi:MAG: class I SAM-dependent methyltransferase [Planctomycetota bacterium]